MTDPSHDTREQQLGLLCAMGAFIGWGLIPIYFKQVAAAPPLEIIAHRIVWTILLLVLIKAFFVPRTGAFRGLLARPRTAAMLALTGCLIASNWLVFVYAVNSERVLQTSLGYFVNPLISVLLGFVLLRERLRPAQYAAIALACVAVAYRIYEFGSLPWISLFLAGTFAAYGLFRKQIDIDAFSGLLAEMMILIPFALGYHVYLFASGQSSFIEGGVGMALGLMLAGPFTAGPLALFAAGARRLYLSSIGLLQYITPSMTFVLAVFYYKEAFDRSQLLTFGLIWVALAIYTYDQLATHAEQRRARRAAIPAPAPLD